MTLISQQRAILFADVVGSTSIYEQLGDRAAAHAIADCLALARKSVDEQQGTVVKNIGDEIMVVFPKAANACEAAMAMQKKVKEMPEVSGIKLAIRVGFQYGPVLEDKGDYWGDAVNTAARFAGLAKAGEIYTGAATAMVLPTELRMALRDLSVISVKGKQDELQVYSVIWEEGEDSTQLAGMESSARVEFALHLKVGERSFDFPSEKNLVSLGRDHGADVPIREKTASRRHAKIERRGVQFYLVDESTNGTYLHIEGDREILLKRDQALLRGSGSISFGVPAAKSEESMFFVCE
ncbi:MAG: adenylate/guanylate cyclase domain-containing protein [Burkholderiales bacterium]